MSESIISAELKGEALPEIAVTKIAEGLGMDNGAGTISAVAQETMPGNEDLSSLTDEVIASPNILVAVSKDENGAPLSDDGCGDGRGIVQRIGAVFTREGALKRSLNRQKVFGGGATMAASTRIGLGLAKDLDANQNFKAAVADMNNRELDFGAHTDNHAHGENCGCGAIDKHPAIVKAATEFREQISTTIESALGVDTTGLDDVLDNFAAYNEYIGSQPYSGRAAMDTVIDNGKVVKELADDHKETRVLLNFVDGYTVDQGYVRDVTGGRAQVFAVDVPRLKQISEGLYDDPAQQHRALLSELVYTLATAAVLTKGDLPVYAITEAE